MGYAQRRRLGQHQLRRARHRGSCSSALPFLVVLLLHSDSVLFCVFVFFRVVFSCCVFVHAKVVIFCCFSICRPQRITQAGVGDKAGFQITTATYGAFAGLFLFLFVWFCAVACLVSCFACVHLCIRAFVVYVSVSLFVLSCCCVVCCVVCVCRHGYVSTQPASPGLLSEAWRYRPSTGLWTCTRCLALFPSLVLLIFSFEFFHLRFRVVCSVL